MVSIKKIFLSAIIVSLVISCEKDKGPFIVNPPPLPVTSDTTDTTNTMISFRNYLQPIFNLRCIHCHNDSHPLLDLQDCCSYDQLLYSAVNAPLIDSVNPETSILIEHLRGINLEIMPPEPPSLSEAKIDSIKTWMLQGARNN